MLLAQRTSLRIRTLSALAAGLAATAATIGAIAGLTAAITVAVVAPLTYLLRRIFDGRHLAANGS
ncbi:MAG: hypothetical protein E6J90_41075 [Deltaproteobacteria bacterium]|nr:MAG: hypothetical protein E6J90_41075 [Deltaproteobacteria bacterium]